MSPDRQALIDRARKLQALATRNDQPHEAAAAGAKLSHFMRQHAITAEELEEKPAPPPYRPPFVAFTFRNLWDLFFAYAEENSIPTPPPDRPNPEPQPKPRTTSNQRRYSRRNPRRGRKPRK